MAGNNNKSSVSNTNNKKSFISDICSPALLYLFFGIMSIIGMIVSNYKATSILFQGIFVFFWTWILNYLCKSGHTGISWFFVIFPFILMSIVLFVMVKNLSADELKKIMKESK
jgi:hypothetical protein